MLQGVAEKFGLLMGAHRGEVEMRVTSAAPLDAKVLKQLESAVGKSKLAQGKKLKVVPRVSCHLLVRAAEAMMLIFYVKGTT